MSRLSWEYHITAAPIPETIIRTSTVSASMRYSMPTGAAHPPSAYAITPPSAT